MAAGHVSENALLGSAHEWSGVWIRPNLDELSSAKERRLNQFGTAVLIWCGKHRLDRLVRQGLPQCATLERQLIQTPLLSCAEPNA